jgi:hypothetical protein
MQDQIAPPADPEEEADGGADVVRLTIVANNVGLDRVETARTATTKTVSTPLPWTIATVQH